jgi:hypothetical protein
MAAPELKAAGFNSLVAVLRTMVPPPDFAAYVDGLPKPCAALIREPPLAVSWVPLADVEPVFSRSFVDLFHRDPARMFELGRLQLRADMTGIYRMFLRIASPQFVTARTADIYRMYARECGTMRVLADQPGRIDVQIEDRPFASSAFYHYLRGSIFGVIELTGVKRLGVAIVDGGGDLPRCHFRITWS